MHSINRKTPKTFRVQFNHGLGDCTYFAHQLEMYTRRGFEFEVACNEDKAVIFRSLSPKVRLAVGASGFPAHSWIHGPNLSDIQMEHYFVSNKAGCNLSRDPMPDIGLLNASLWAELCEIKLSLRQSGSTGMRASIEDKVSKMARPIVLVHANGNSFHEQKDMDELAVLKLHKQVVNETGGTVIVLDWDRRSGSMAHHRVKDMITAFGRLNVEQLYHLIDLADLLVGIDSGPAHFARFTDTPVLGVWYQHHPAVYAFPRSNHVHMVPKSRFHAANLLLRTEYQILESGDQRVRGEDIGRVACRMLQGARFLGSGRLGADILLQEFLSWCDGGFSPMKSHVDRHHSFGLVISHLGRLGPGFLIVETGTIRMAEDWSGAGFSTYLFGYIAKLLSGRLVSVDNEPANCLFSQTHTKCFDGAVSVVRSDSRHFLKGLKEEVDVLYLDSLDTDLPQCAEHALEEAKCGYPRVKRGGLILLDDSPFTQGSYLGKGRLAVDWLLQQGCELLFSGHQVLLRKNGGRQP